MIISFLNQKGGVGKSTLARAVAVEFVKNQWDVHLADMDNSQRTSTLWAQEREQNARGVCFSVATYNNIQTAIKATSNYDLTVIDGTAYADKSTIEAAKVSDLVVIPTGITVDDLRASLGLAQELTLKAGLSKSAIMFVVVKVPDNGDKEAMATKKSIAEWGYNVANGWLPYKTSYGQAMDEGRTITETRFKPLNEKADRLIQSIAERATEMQQTEKAS